LRGKLRLEYWDPHTGSIRAVEAAPANDNGEPVTRFKLKLLPIRSIFVIGCKTT
jgi:hypothetical protein